jgi:hypothetical protein
MISALFFAKVDDTDPERKVSKLRRKKNMRFRDGACWAQGHGCLASTQQRGNVRSSTKLGQRIATTINLARMRNVVV